jgi:hypothetical protein
VRSATATATATATAIATGRRNAVQLYLLVMSGVVVGLVSGLVCGFLTDIVLVRSELVSVPSGAVVTPGIVVGPFIGALGGGIGQLITGEGVVSGVRAGFFGNIFFGVLQILLQCCQS